jgi:hypothetical protein
MPGAMRSPMASEDKLSFVECGKAGGKFSAMIPRWAGNFEVISTIVP